MNTNFHLLGDPVHYNCLGGARLVLVGPMGVLSNGVERGKEFAADAEGFDT